MKNKICILLIIALGLACNSSSKSTKANEKSTNQEWSYDQGKASSLLNELIAELKEDSNESDLKAYEPSDADRKKYGIKKIDGINYAGGILKVIDSYKAGNFDQYGVKTSTTAGNIITAMVPLGELVNLLNSSELVYFEMNNTIKTR